MSDAVETPGPALRRERERQGLSVQKAADEMHLDTWVIDALETDTYTRLGPAVYAKGHLKKYAALLGLPAAQILAGYDSLHLGAQQPQATSVRSLVPNSALHNLPWGKIAGAAVVVLLILGVVWWQPWQQRLAATRAAKQAVAEAPSTDATPPAEPPVVVAPPPESEPMPQGVPGGAVVAQSAPPPPAPVAAPESGAGRARLRMSFSADSWVDVRDARGKRVFAGNGRANSVKSLAGEAPLRVYLGFASGVQLEINEHAVAIGPQFVNGEVARFEAGADGVLRRDLHAARPRG